MTEIIKKATELSNQYEAELMTWGPVIVLLTIALMLSFTTLKNWIKEQKINRKIRQLGVAVIRNIALPDGMDGRVLVENIVLTGEGIYILPVKRYCGIIFAADNIETWTQVVGKRSYKFPNPLTELEAYVMAVRNILPGIKVEGRILVTNDAAFPKGKPDRVIPIPEVLEALVVKKGDVSSQLTDAWNKLKTTGLELNQEERKVIKHINTENGNSSQQWVSVSLVCVGIGWLLWRLLY